MQTRAAQYWRQQTDRLDAQRRLAAERSDADSRAAHGAERLRLQAADRAAVIELLTAPEPPTASLGLEVEDCGLEL